MREISPSSRLHARARALRAQSYMGALASMPARRALPISACLSLASAETAFIAGASRGLGLELARSFAAADDKAVVHATTRSPPNRPGTLGSIRGVRPHTLDVTNASQVTDIAARLLASGGAIDVLVHSAGINNGTLERQVEVNAVAPFRLVEALMPALLRSQHRRVCIVTSDRGQHHYVRKFRARFAPGSRHGGGRLCHNVPYCAYAVSKGKAHETFRRLEPAWRVKGLTAVVVHPGFLATDMNGGMERCLREQAKARARKGGGGGSSSTCTTAAQRAPDIRRLCSSLVPRDAGKFLNWRREELPW